MSRWLQWSLLISLLVVLVLGLFFWQKKKLTPQPEISTEVNQEVVQDPLTTLNEFPLKNMGEEWESYTFKCQFVQLFSSQDYQQATILNNGWRSLAELTCRYLNANQQLEVIYLPVHLFHPLSEKSLVMGDSVQTITEEKIVERIAVTATAWYQKVIEYALGQEKPLSTDTIIYVNATFPTRELVANQAQGVGLESVKNLKELEQALLTDGGFKLTSFAKLAYKSVDGNWQIIKVPLTAYDVENNVFWIKDVSTRSGSSFDSYERVIRIDADNNLTRPLTKYWTAASKSRNYHSGTGSFIKLFTGWPENPRWANNDAALGDPPRYTEEQLTAFRLTGDPSIFGYQDADGYYIWWPIITFDADLSAVANYEHD